MAGRINRQAEGTPLLDVRELDAFYGQIQALRGVSLEVRAGEIVAVVGANGAGKTTLLRCLSGMLPVSQGEILFQGQSIAGLRTDQIVALGVIHVPERRELFGPMTVLENLKLGAQRRNGREEKAALQRDLDVIWEMFPILRARQNQMAGTLSGGEQQMLAIARGLIARPDLLLLDEPSLGLAPLLVQEVLRVVVQLREMGRTVLLVEQNAAGALQVADRAYVMEVGRIVMSGTTFELLKDDRIRRAYLGQRIAPMRRPYQGQTISAPPQARGQKGTRRRVAAKEGGMMAARTALWDDPIPERNWTLPDEYFQERVSQSVEELEAIQDKDLPQAFAYAFEHSAFYREKFTAAGLTPALVRGLADLARLPFTTSEEIRPDSRQGRPTSHIMAVPQAQVTVVHRSSGTTGAPKIFPYTGRDAARWSANVGTVNWITGLRKGDTVLSPGLSREFTGSGGGYLGALALGMTYIPITIGPGISETIMAHLTGRMEINAKVIELDPLLRANALKVFPSFLPRLLDIIDESGVRPEEISLTKIGCGSEPSSDAIRMRIAERLGIWPRDDYGLGEFYGPGVAGECEAGGCLHVLSDTFIAEVIDPDTGQPCSEGEIGELVLTSLHKEAFPLFRFRTGDRVMALPQNCECGMGHLRIGRVTGRIRADDIFMPGGVMINRTYLEEVLLPVDGTGCDYAVTVADHPRHKGLQQLFIAVEAEDDERVRQAIVHRFRIEYKYAPMVHILPPGSIPRTWGKAKRLWTPEEYWALIKGIKGVAESNRD